MALIKSFLDGGRNLEAPNDTIIFILGIHALISSKPLIQGLPYDYHMVKASPDQMHQINPNKLTKILNSVTTRL